MYPKLIWLRRFYLMLVREDLERLFGLHISKTNSISDLFNYFDRSGKMTQKNLMGAIIICLEHIEKLENESTYRKELNQKTNPTI